MQYIFVIKKELLLNNFGFVVERSSVFKNISKLGLQCK